MYLMASLSIYILIAYHLIFFWWAYTKPFTLATSESLSTFFPSWRYNEKTDPYYWYNMPGHPVLSTYYPFSRLVSMCCHKLGLDLSFTAYVYQSLAHYLMASVGWYYLFLPHLEAPIALFGAITFTYQTYHLKQQPCIIYTLSWLPWTLLGLDTNNLWLASVGIGMILLSGYYPLSMYLLPAVYSIFPQTLPFLIGLVIGSPQVIPFLKYLPKTVRSHSREDVSPGYWEKNYYIGIVPIVLLITTIRMEYIWIIVPVVLSYLMRKVLPRVYQRAWILSAHMAIFASLLVLPSELAMVLCMVQAYDLWTKRQSMVTRPFNELQKRPSHAFNNRLTNYLKYALGNHRVSGLPYPLFTGLINHFRTEGYQGGMRLNLMEKHGYPRLRVKFAYSRKKLDWKPTPVKHLWLNPEF
jgi:hypothetical protein